MAERFFATPIMRRAPIASTRACSTASNTARACWPPGNEPPVHRRIVAGQLERRRIGMAAHDRGVLPVSLRDGSGSRTLPPTSPGRSAANDTSSSGLRAIARTQPAPPA